MKQKTVMHTRIYTIHTDIHWEVTLKVSLVVSPAGGTRLSAAMPKFMSADTV